MKKLTDHRGAAAVEFALVIIPLILLVFGTVEFGVLMYNQQVITNASREGARAGIVAQTPRVTSGEISTVVNTYTTSHLITFGAANTPVTTVNAAGAGFGDDLTVNVTYQYSFLVIPNFVPGIAALRTMSATTVMKYE